KLYEGGLSVRTTLDPKLQVMARKTMTAGLVKFDEATGYRGAVQQLEIAGDWGPKLADIKSLSDISPWRMAVVLETSDQSARVGRDPWTGRVLAMVGGFSFDQSQFNRARQAYRQPGSSFKPLVYSAAMDNGYTPSTVVVDAPIEIDQGQGAGVWRPENYSTGKYRGPTTLRNALRWSLNTVTVRLAQDIGMPLIGEYAKRFGVYDELPNYLS